VPASRNYSSTAGLMHLVGGISGAAASLIVDVTTGLPAVPFTLLLDPGLGVEEVVTVTAVGGTTLTVTRGVDGTSAQAHTNGAEVRHAYSARDFQDSRDHEANTTTAHGVTGAVVGTTNVQVLTNKDLSSGTNVFPATLATRAGIETFTNKTLTAPALNAPTLTAATAAGTTTVTPLTVTMPLTATADAVSVTISSASGVAYDGKFKVGSRGDVTVKAMNDLGTGADVPALLVQGGGDGAGATPRDIQRWVARDGTTVVAKIDKDGNLTAANFTPADDTGWITPALGSGWTSTTTPQYRRLNGVTYLQGFGNTTGAVAVAFTLPALFRPGAQRTQFAEAGGTQVRAQVSATGAVGQVVAASAAGFSFGSIQPFPADA